MIKYLLFATLLSHSIMHGQPLPLSTCFFLSTWAMSDVNARLLRRFIMADTAFSRAV